MTHVTVIIVNWNGRELLRTCLTALRKQTFRESEIVLVDNGSHDGSCELVRTKFREVRLIRLERNMGFAEANNIGIRASDSRYIATLNNDTEASEQWLERLVQEAEKQERIGSCASKMVRYHDSRIIDSAGIEVLASGEVKDRGHGVRDCGEFDRIEEVFGACAGAALYRRDMLAEIGLFPTRYFASYEDVALAWRAAYAGWRCMYVPGAVVRHVRFISQNRLLTEDKGFFVQKLRNRMSYQIEYLPGGSLSRSIARLSALYLSAVRLSLKLGTTEFLKTAVLIPEALKARRRHRSELGLRYSSVRRWLTQT